MFCHQCGSGVSDDAATCGSCGAALRSKNPGDTQPIQAPDATIRMATPSDAASGGGPAVAMPVAPAQPLPATTVMTAVDASTIAKPPASTGPSTAPRQSAPLVLLFGAAVLLGVAGWGAYQWSAGRAAERAAAANVASATAAATNAANAASSAVTAATAAAVDATAAVTPAAAPVEPPAADPVATPAGSAAVQPATGPGSGPALLAAARKERDAAIAQRDAALDQVKQLNSDLTHARAAAAPATPAPAASPTSASDAARLAQLQKDHDTVRYVAGSRKQLLADKVIESHLYLLPPPASLTQISLSQTTEITLDAKSYGLNSVKNVVVIPSSVWENTDYKISNSGSSVTFTILRPDAFRTFARYFVLMLE
jgi:hypothetical protein